MLGALLLSHAHAEDSVQCSAAPLSSIKHQTSFPLPLQLFKEADWQTCRIECARVIISAPTPQLHLMHAICGLRLGLDSKPELEKLCNQSRKAVLQDGFLQNQMTEGQKDKRTENQPPALSTKNPEPSPQNLVPSTAHYELGRAYWIEGDNNKALQHLKKAFFATASIEIHQMSGCTLYQFLEENPALASEAVGLKTILATYRKEWDRELFHECSKPKKQKNNIATAPARGLISFYQKQIGPAIGDRCSLHPSCSRYAMQALKTHGMVGAGAMGDRFIREPDVVSAKENPVKINGHIKYSDPLSDHDWWMKK